MEIFQKAFNRERNKLYQNGRPTNNPAITKKTGFPEYAIHFSSARKYYESENLNNALQSVNRAVELSPVYDWRQYALKALVLEEMDKFQEAIKYYEKAIEINPEDINVYGLYHQIGVCYALLGNSEKALEFYTWGIELKKQHPNSPDNEDREGLESGVVLGREFVHMYANRGSAYNQLGQLQEAEKDCLHAIALNPDYSNPYLVLFYVYNTSGQAKKAIEFLEKAVNSGNTDALKVMNALDESHEVQVYCLTDEIRAELKECLDVTFEQLDLEEGKRRSLNLINKGIHHTFPYFCLASIYEAEENWKACEDISKEGLRICENEDLFLNTLGVAICRQGVHRVPEGLEYFEKGALAGNEKCAENYKIWKDSVN